MSPPKRRPELDQAPDLLGASRRVDRWAWNFGVGSAFALMLLGALFYFACRVLDDLGRQTEAMIQVQIAFSGFITATEGRLQAMERASARTAAEHGEMLRSLQTLLQRENAAKRQAGAGIGPPNGAVYASGEHPLASSREFHATP